jgi:hypothetical protein
MLLTEKQAKLAIIEKKIAFPDYVERMKNVLWRSAKDNSWDMNCAAEFNSLIFYN